MPIVPNPLQKSRTPDTRAVQGRRSRASHMHQLVHHGEAYSLVHRRKCGGRQQHLRDAMRRVFKDRGTARWCYQPWPRHAPTHVLIVTLGQEGRHG